MGSSCVVTVEAVDHLVPRGGSMSVGTGDAADIQVDDRRVQGLHARIEDVDGDFLFVDESSDGSYLGDTGRAIRGGSYLLPRGTTVMRLADQDDGPELTIGVSTSVGASVAASPAGPAPPLPDIPTSSLPAPAPLPPQDPAPSMSPPLPSALPPPPAVSSSLPSALPPPQPHPPPHATPPPPPPSPSAPDVESPFALPGSDLPARQPVPAGIGVPPGPGTSPGGTPIMPTPPPPPAPPSPAAGWTTTTTAVAPAPPPPPPPPGSAWATTTPGTPVPGALAAARPWWGQPAVYVVLVVVGLVAAVVMFAVVQTSGTTSAQDLAARRCYEQPDGEFTRLKEQDCAGVHDLEVIMTATMLPGPFPSADQFEAEVNRVCGPAFDTVDWQALPADADGGWFEPNRAGWELGDHDLACYVYSDTGLVDSAPRLDR